MQTERSLVLGMERRTVNVGEPVTIEVRDRSNRPIEDAVVDAGSKRLRTDSRGRCELTLHSPGFWKIVARKAATERIAYEPASVLVRALPRSRTGRGVRRTGPPTL